jgi:hypothetical protein
VLKDRVLEFRAAGVCDGSWGVGLPIFEKGLKGLELPVCVTMMMIISPRCQLWAVGALFKGARRIHNEPQMFSSLVIEVCMMGPRV